MGPAWAQRFGAETRMFFVHDRRDNEAASRADVLFDNLLRGSDHGGDAALHVLSASSVQPPIAMDRLKGVFHARNAHGIEMAAEHQRRPGFRALEHRDDIRAPGRDLADGDREPGLGAFGRDATGDFGLARCARDQRRIHRIYGDEGFQEGDGRIGMSDHGMFL